MMRRYPVPPGLPLMDTPPLPSSRDGQPRRLLTPEPPQSVALATTTAKGQFFRRLPTEIRLRILRLAFGDRTIHYGTIPPDQCNVYPGLSVVDWTKNSKKDWRWQSSVCHRLPPSGIIDSRGPGYDPQPCDDVSMDGTAEMASTLNASTGLGKDKRSAPLAPWDGSSPASKLIVRRLDAITSIEIIWDFTPWILPDINEELRVAPPLSDIATFRQFLQAIPKLFLNVNKLYVSLQGDMIPKSHGQNSEHKYSTKERIELVEKNIIWKVDKMVTYLKPHVDFSIAYPTSTYAVQRSLALRYGYTVKQRHETGEVERHWRQVEKCQPRTGYWVCLGDKDLQLKAPLSCPSSHPTSLHFTPPSSQRTYVMASELATRIGDLNPFSSKSRRINDEDFGEEIDNNTVAGGGHSARRTVTDLRVSSALREFLVKEKMLSKKEAKIDSEDSSRELLELVSKPHIRVPPELTDRSHPLPEYFISSSHNTYLMAHQLYGSSCATAYESAIRTGARCVEIDAWDNSDDRDEPKVTHGYTLVSNISFRLVCETIRNSADQEAVDAQKYGFRASPILLSLENHCDAYGQMRLVNIMQDVFGDRLLSKAVRHIGHEEQAGSDQHVKLEYLGAKIAVIVEYHFTDEPSSSDSNSDDSEDEEEEKAARKEYKDKRKKEEPSIIIPELAELGVYAQSVKPMDSSWFEEGSLANGPHHHLINVSESGLASHLPEHASNIARHNAHHLMRVFPKGTRISSTNLKPVPYWGIGAQICALNLQNFGTSNQLNEALFSGTDGYVLKPAALRAGGNGRLSTGRSKRLRLHVAGATDVPLHGDSEADSIKPYLTCTLYHPDNIKGDPPKRKTEPYKQHKLEFLHRGPNPPPTEPLWDETLTWEYEDNELTFLRMLIKSDDSWTRNPMFAVAAVRLLYVEPGWRFIRMLDLKGHETQCSVLVNFEIIDA
ncbi:hypothetical protein FPHYL_9189 [Fusarium phyllophilum]|uniref:Phosphoinositide phospholipase C n=1 Tax=Fusarium phyllophilum TaxID=47803 RepID=A0A8H5N3U8_9HYPO|nr:hypothetical protein FPHYL_9189 [Fusarium phyllophilum]